MDEKLLIQVFAVCAFAIPIAISDARFFRVPDALSLGGIAAVLLLRATLDTPALPMSWAAGLAGFGIFWLIRALSRGKLGMGDVKFSAFIGVTAGPLGWFESVFLGCVIALSASACRAAFRGFCPGGRIAFAPFLTFGLAASVIANAMGFSYLRDGA
jgi:prepilin signal peptidase PulO-like enzyme (type II secretory pathway)